MSKTITIDGNSTIDIYYYMQFRAEIEGVAFDLEHKWFAANFYAGIRSFFGVQLDDEGNILEDTQKPEILEDWRQMIEENESPEPFSNN